jgi:hypothetical protein
MADIGAFSLAHPPATDFSVPTEVQHSIQTYRHAFLVTEGHHNRVLHVKRSIHTVGDVLDRPTSLE